MEEFFLPVLSHFQNGNAWTGSGGRLRYQLVPGEETLEARVWEGPFCLELSQVEEGRSFALTEEGLGELRAWLTAWETAINARPARSLAETYAMRDRAAAAQAEAGGAAS